MGVKTVVASIADNEKTPQGFKKTEIGLLPSDWKVEKIGEMARIKTGAKNTQDNVSDGAYPFFVRSQKVERIDSFSYDAEAVLTAGDGVGTGKVFHYVKGRFDVHQRVYCISNFGSRLNGRYFFYQFSRMFYNRIASMTAKSSVDSVRMDMISAMQIPVSPIHEQYNIASALSDADALIESLDGLIAKKRAVKLATMQKLLTGERRMSGFTKPWEHKLLGELGEFAKGQGIKADDVTDDGVACIRYGELYTRYRNYFTQVASRIPLRVAAQALRIRKGDLLFPASGETAEEIGMCAAYLGEEDAYAGGDVIVFSPRGQDSVFLAHLLNSNPVARQKARLSHGEVIVHINARTLGVVQLKIPDLSEQEAIAKVFVDMDQEVSRLEQRREKVNAMKQGMMQALLTGKVRLVEQEVKA